MSIEVKTLTPESSSYLHFRYNTLVQPGVPTIEYARYGSVLLDSALAIKVLAVAIESNPELPLGGKIDLYKAVNQGLRILQQTALKAALKKQGKMDGQAEKALRNHLPDLFTN